MKVLLLPLLLLSRPGHTLSFSTLGVLRPHRPSSIANPDHHHHHHHDHDAHERTRHDYDDNERYVYNATVTASPLCPMLYTRVGDRCIAFFTNAWVSWSAAKQFCESIFGQMWTFSDITEYLELLNYIRDSGVDVDLWVGGQRLTHSYKTWVWLDNSTMPMGTPYWTVRHIPIDFNNDEFVFENIQAPEVHIHQPCCPGRCAAMTYKYHFYLSDEECSELKSPVCVLRKDAQVLMVRGSEDPYPAIHVPQEDATSTLATEGPTEKVPGYPDVEEEDSGTGYYIDGHLVDYEESGLDTDYVDDDLIFWRMFDLD